MLHTDITVFVGFLLLFLFVFKLSYYYDSVGASSNSGRLHHKLRWFFVCCGVLWCVCVCVRVCVRACVRAFGVLAIEIGPPTD